MSSCPPLQLSCRLLTVLPLRLISSLLHISSAAGCGLPPGPYNLLGAAEGISYLTVLTTSSHSQLFALFCSIPCVLQAAAFPLAPTACWEQQRASATSMVLPLASVTQQPAACAVSCRLRPSPWPLRPAGSSRGHQLPHSAASCWWGSNM
jgi:hypothetical protein